MACIIVIGHVLQACKLKVISAIDQSCVYMRKQFVSIDFLNTDRLTVHDMFKNK